MRKFEKPSIQILSADQNREKFNCGKAALNKYIQSSVDRDIKNRLTRCYVLTFGKSKQVSGFYTLSNHAVKIAQLPKKYGRRIPPGYLVPTILLGRLAVDIEFKGRGLGEFLLVDSIRRSLSASEISNAFALVVQYKDDNAKSFYEKFGFIPFTDKYAMQLFLPLKTAADVFF